MSPEILILILLMGFMGLMARSSGGGALARFMPGFLPELIFAMAIACAAAHRFAGEHDFPWILASVVVSYLAMQTGHGTAFKMGLDPATAQSGRVQSLSRVVDPICRWLNWPLGELRYCFLFMGIKGFLIGLPLLHGSFAMALLWPASYLLGALIRETKKDPSATEIGEWVSGMATGAVIWFIAF